MIPVLVFGRSTSTEVFSGSQKQNKQNLVVNIKQHQFPTFPRIQKAVVWVLPVRPKPSGFVESLNTDVLYIQCNLKDFESSSVCVFLLNPNRPDSFRPPHRSWLSLVPAPLEDAARQLLQLVSRYVLQL